MKFLMMVKVDENSGMPPQELFDAMDVYVAKQQKSGVVVDTAGLTPSSQGARVRITKGKIKVIDGPFTEAKEVVGGYAIVNAASRDEAIEMAREFMQLHVDHWPGWEGESEVRQLAEF